MKLDATTYQNVADNTAFNTVLDATMLLAWRQNVKAAVDANSAEGQYAADAGTTDAYAVTLSPAPTSYSVGMVVRFKANTANTGAASLNANNLGVIPIKKNYNSDLATGDIVANQIVEVVYDGTNFQLLSLVGLANYLALVGGIMTGNITLNNDIRLMAKDAVGTAKTIAYIDTSNGLTLGSTTNFMNFNSNGTVFLFNGVTALLWGFGIGSPEGVAVGKVGSLFLRTDGGAGTTLYVKQSGTGNVGWVGK